MDLTFLGQADYTLKETFVSKQNKVFLLERAGSLLVCKKYLNDGLLREQQILSKLRAAGLAVPQVLEVGEDYLLLSYLEGINLCDFLRQEEAQNREGREVIEPLWSWLEQFYACLQQGRGDVNLRNFIWDRQKKLLYGVDFTDAKNTDRITDWGNILAYALSYDPVFTTWKFSWVKAAAAFLLEHKEINSQQLCRAYQRALGDLAHRRQLTIPHEVFELLTD
ncbi:MAG: RIO1 family regulatory kinase/ATPase [Bacillota bacterium]|jgi:hypothetical protein